MTHAPAFPRNRQSRRIPSALPGAQKRILPILAGLLLATACLFALSCGGDTAADGSRTTPAVKADEAAMAAEVTPDFSSPDVVDASLAVAGLPESLEWHTSKPGIFGSSRARQGGTWRGWLQEFPATFRTVGPNSNTGFRSYLNNGPGLVELNGQTKEWMPGLATHWAFGADGASVFYKLNEQAKWSDGTPVTSADYVFMRAFYRSPNLNAPWYNEYYTNQITQVEAFGDWVIKVTSNAPAPHDELLMSTSIAPRPARFYQGTVAADYVDRYQWEAEPGTGPYALSDWTKGESVTFTKVKDWWGHCYDYNKYRYNVDTIQLTVISGGMDIAKNWFLDGQLESHGVIIPQYWSESDDFEGVQKGWMERQVQYYVPVEGLSGLIMNTGRFPLDNKDVRLGLTHSVDMDRMLQTALQGAYTRYHNIGLGHVFAGRNFDDDTIRMPAFDAAKAGEYFDKAGFSAMGDDGIRVDAKGRRLSLEILYSASIHTERLSVLKEEARKAGVDLELKIMQQGMFNAVLEKNFQIAWLAMGTGLYDDYWEYFHSSNAKPQTNNFFNYANPEMDRMLDAFRASGDLDEKADLSHRIQKMVHDEALVIPNYYVPFVRTVHWKWWRFPAWLGQRYDASFSDPLSGSTGGYLWLDPEIKAETEKSMEEDQAYAPRTWVRDEYKAD